MPPELRPKALFESGSRMSNQMQRSRKNGPNSKPGVTQILAYAVPNKSHELQTTPFPRCLETHAQNQNSMFGKCLTANSFCCARIYIGYLSKSIFTVNDARAWAMVVQEPRNNEVCLYHQVREDGDQCQFHWRFACPYCLATLLTRLSRSLARFMRAYASMAEQAVCFHFENFIVHA